jgi:uncharacterized protein YbjT (DUF2867 family)
MYLIAGATGNVGGEVVRALTEAGEPVRALIRSDADKTKLPEGAEGFVGDLNDTKSLAPALEGIRGAHLLAGYKGLDELVTEMPSAGVERVVLQSSSAAPTGDLTDAVAKYHILSERAIEESGLGWTFLRPNSFMSNALRWLPQLEAGDIVRDAFPDVPVATIDPHDVAAVSAAALTSGEHDGKAYRLSGPDSLLPAERLAILAKALGRDLRFEGQSDEEARAEMSENTPAEYVDSFFRVFRGDDIDESTVLPTVREVLGREPRSFEEWTTEHADAFR